MLSLNLDLNYFTNPKVERLACILGAGSEIHHVRLMVYVGKCGRKHGGLDDWSADEVEAAAHWYGEKGCLVEALLKVKLIHPWKNGFKLHDWKEHAAHLISYDDRCEINRKKAKDGWKKRRKPNGEKEKEPDANGMPPALPNDGVGITKTKQNKTETTIADFEPSSVDIHEASMTQECMDVHAYWVKARAEAGMKTMTGQDKPEAARVAAYIMAGVFSMEYYRNAVDRLMEDDKSRSLYGLRGLLKNIDRLANQKPKTQDKPERFGIPLREIMAQQGCVNVG